VALGDGEQAVSRGDAGRARGRGGVGGRAGAGAAPRSRPRRSAQGRGVLENKHSTDVKSSPARPLVYMSIHLDSRSRSNLDRVPVLNDSPVRRGGWHPPPRATPSATRCQRCPTARGPPRSAPPPWRAPTRTSAWSSYTASRHGHPSIRFELMLTQIVPETTMVSC